MVGSRVWKSRSPTPTPAPVSALSSVDLPAFVYPARATVGSAARSRSARITARLRSTRPQLAAQRGDPVARQAAVGLDLRLARATGADPAVDAPGAEALEVRPQAPHAGEVVFELRQLDLELPLGRVGVVGEDVEDHRGAVDHRHAERLLQVALLAGHQLVVDGDQVGVGSARSRASARRAFPGPGSGRDRAGCGPGSSRPAVATPAVRSSSFSSARGSSRCSSSRTTPTAMARWRARGLTMPAEPFTYMALGLPAVAVSLH